MLVKQIPINSAVVSTIADTRCPPKTFPSRSATEIWIWMCYGVNVPIKETISYSPCKSKTFYAPANLILTADTHPAHDIIDPDAFFSAARSTRNYLISAPLVSL